MKRKGLFGFTILEVSAHGQSSSWPRGLCGGSREAVRERAVKPSCHLEVEKPREKTGGERPTTPFKGPGPGTSLSRGPSS